MEIRKMEIRKKFATFCNITMARTLHRLVKKICAVYGEDTLSKSVARK